MLKIQVCILSTDWEIPRQGALRLDRGGRGRSITDIDYMVKKRYFLLNRPYRKKQYVSEISRCLKIRYDCGKKHRLQLLSTDLKYFSIYTCSIFLTPCIQAKMFILVNASWMFKWTFDFCISKHQEILIELSSDLWITEKKL